MSVLKAALDNLAAGKPESKEKVADSSDLDSDLQEIFDDFEAAGSRAERFKALRAFVERSRL